MHDKPNPRDNDNIRTDLVSALSEYIASPALKQRADLEQALKAYLCTGHLFPAHHLQCIDCAADVHVDSTPDLDRCWQCAERHDEAVAR